MKTYRVAVKHLYFKKPAVSVYEIQAADADKARAIVNNSLVMRDFTKDEFSIESVEEIKECDHDFKTDSVRPQQ